MWVLYEFECGDLYNFERRSYNATNVSMRVSKEYVSRLLLGEVKEAAEGDMEGPALHRHIMPLLHAGLLFVEIAFIMVLI